MSLHTDAKRVRERERVRRLIIGYDKVDERRVRHLADKTPDTHESARLFTRVIFDPDFINDLRGGELSLTTDINVLRVLDSSNLASRLYKVLNYFTNEGRLEFSLEIKELAHERLGISHKTAAPSQCWQKISHAFEKLQQAAYLISYEYDRTTGYVSGKINRKFAAQRPAPLPPLPTNIDRCAHLKKRFAALGTYPNAAAAVLKKLPDELFGEAELIVDRIEQIKRENTGKGKDFKWGGWAYNELVDLLEQGYINPNLLDSLEDEDESPDGQTGDNTPAARPVIVCTDARAAALWSRVTNELAKQLNEHVLATWFGAAVITPVQLDGRKLILHAANQVVRDWVSSNYAAELQSALGEAAGKKSGLEIVWQVSEAE